VDISTDGGDNYTSLFPPPASLPAAGDPITLNLGTVSTDTLIRFASDSSLANLGAVTINGTLGSAGVVLSLLVVHRDEDPFPVQPAEPLPAGVINVGGFTISNSGLRANTRIAVAATGNLTGSIEVGHVFRLQFNGSVGEIQAAVTAIAENGSAVTYTGVDDENNNPYHAEPMAYIRESKKISGNLTATAGDIGIVSIGTTAAATDGLQANVKALSGQIKSIYCAGAIGNSAASPAVLPEIWARDRIGEIIARDSESMTPEDVLEKDFYASVKAGKGRTSEGAPMPREDGALTMIRTKGDYDGVIDVFNISQPDGTDAQCGILVDGEVLCAINVDYLVHGDIIASSFPQPITIGVQLKGALVATDQAKGVITSVTVGRSDTTRAKQYTEIWVYPAEEPTGAVQYTRGLVGANPRPNDYGIRFPAAEDAWFGTSRTACNVSNGIFNGAIDRLIRAPRIDFLSVAAMTQDADSVGTLDKKNPPRIEAVSIGECIVDYLHTGVIWSGQLEFDSGCSNCGGTGFACIDNDPSNDFAMIESLAIECIARYGAVWFTGCEHPEFGNVFGGLHVDTLAADETIWIREQLGTDQYCDMPAEYGYSDPVFNQDYDDGTPRTINGPSVSRIVIHDAPDADPTPPALPTGLVGQIIINGGNNENAEDFWAGTVEIGSSVTLGEGLGGDDEAPHYNRLPADLGGGSVGLAPFGLHGTACVPPHDTIGLRLQDQLVYTDFDVENSRPVRIRSYGPVTSTAVTIYAGVVDPEGDGECTTADITAMFDKTLHPDGDPRSIGLGCDAAYLMKTGIIRVVPSGIACADVDGNPDVGWQTMPCSEPGYWTEVAPDCNNNGDNDQWEIDEDINQPITGCIGNCAADWDGNFDVAVPDIFAFLSDWFANEPTAICYGVEDPPSPPTVPPCGVVAIFNFLSDWFASRGDDCAA